MRYLRTQKSAGKITGIRTGGHSQTKQGVKFYGALAAAVKTKRQLG